MAVAAAEQLHQFNYFPDLAEVTQPEVPLVFAIPDMLSDELTRRRADRFIALADTAMRHEVELNLAEEGEDHSINSLKDAIHRAAAGDEKGRKVLETNAATDVIERTVKVAHVIEVKLEVDANENIHQHGQSMQDVQSNSLRHASSHPSMRSRVEAETRNSFRIQESYQEGSLDDYVFVVISRAADDMSQPAMQKAGFFTDTMSTAIQATTMKDGVLTTESAFVAGIKKPGEEQHDAETVVALGQEFGVDLTGKSATEIIDTPLLIHKSLLPNGVVDLVKKYDDCAGGTFFGQDQPHQDYLQFRASCKEREKTFEQKVEAIVGEVISQAASVQTEVQATTLLNKISGKHMVDKAVEDKSIDPRVFGEEAAAYIVQARLHQDLGNTELAMAAIARAKTTQKSYSCPGEAISNNEKDARDKDESNSKSCVEIKDGDITNCPHCKKKGVRAVVPKRGGAVYCSNKSCEFVAPSLKSAGKTGTNETRKDAYANVFSLIQKPPAKPAKQQKVGKAALIAAA